MRALGLELFDDGEEVADRAGEPVEPDHDQRLAGADVAQQAREHWPRAISAGGVFLVQGGAAGGAKVVELRIGTLLFGGHACVSDQAA